MDVVNKTVPFIVGALLFGLLVSPACGNPVVVYSPNPVGVGVAFVDVVLIEAIVLAWIAHRAFIACLGAAALANLVSTIPGTILFQHSFDDSAQLLLAGEGRAVLLLQIGVSFLLSIFIEYLILRILWRKSLWQVTAQATLAANVVSYLLVTPVLLLMPRVFIGFGW